jgi:hypothetical protein
VVDENLDQPLEIGWPQAEAVIRALPEVTTHAHDGVDVLLRSRSRDTIAAPCRVQDGEGGDSDADVPGHIRD